MPHIQRLGALGLGVEAVAGTAVTPTHWVQFSNAPKVNDKFDYQDITTARGRVEKSQDHKLMKTSGEGKFACILDEDFVVLPFGLTLGTVASASAGGGFYEHTITIKNDNTPKTATCIIDRVQDIRKFTNCVIENLSLKVGDSFVEMDIDFKSKASATGTASESYNEVTRYTFKEMSAQFGADVTAAELESATPLSGMDLKIKRTVEMTYQTGSNDPAKINHGVLETSGNYSLLFDSTTERDKYLADTMQAVILKFTDATGNFVKITIPKVKLNNWDPSNDMDKIVSQSSDFGAHYDATTGESIRVVVKNKIASYLNF